MVDSDRNWLALTVSALAGLTVGLLLGLLIAAIVGEPFEELEAQRKELEGQCGDLEAERDQLLHQNERATTEPDGIDDSPLAQRSTLKENRSSRSDAPWLRSPSAAGVLARIPESIGPGSAFDRFANALAVAEAWDPNRYWVIVRPTFRPRAHMMLSRFGDGKVDIEGVVPCTRDPLSVSLIFRPGKLSTLTEAGSTEAARNLHDEVMAVGKAMELSSLELERLDTFVCCVPLVPANAIDRGVIECVGYMPVRVRRRFAELLRYYVSDRMATQLEPPAIGALLSDRLVVEIVFAATENGVVYRDLNYLEPGAWWTLFIHDAVTIDYTSSEEPSELIEGQESISWPRLTVEEVDQLGK